MEDLDKNQVILLAIFVAFVSSVATGVVVVTLMDQSSTGVTQTINRVVERTIERVTAPGKTETVKLIVKEDETVVNSIKEVRKAIVRVVRYTGDSALLALQKSEEADVLNLTQEALLPVAIEGIALVDESKIVGEKAIGIFLTSDGWVVSNSNIILAGDFKYSAVTSEMKEIPLRLVNADSASGLAFFKTIKAETHPFIQINSVEADLGQTAIAVGIESDPQMIYMGFVSSFRSGNASTTAMVKTSIKAGTSMMGRPIVNINGGLIGIYAPLGEVTPAFAIKNLLESSKEFLKTKPAETR